MVTFELFVKIDLIIERFFVSFTEIATFIQEGFIKLINSDSKYNYIITKDYFFK